jgi:hypothetical protein
MRPGGFPGHEFVPRPQPAQVRVEVEGLIRNRPAQVFGHLGGINAEVLPPAERTALAAKAVSRLASDVESARDVRAVHAEVRTAREGAAGFGPEVQGGLEVVARLAERRVLAEGVREVLELVKDGKRADVRAKAEEWLHEVPAVGAEGAEAETLRVRARDAFKELSGVGRLQEALDRLAEGIPAEGRLQAVDVGSLPEALQAAVRGLRGLAVLRAEAGKAGSMDAAGARTAAREFEAALKGVPAADPTLAKQVLQDLAAKAFLEGRPDEFRALWPADGPAEHAADLLRDMKALALGEGKVSTWPAERALTPEPGKGGDNPRGPPKGVEPLVPEASRQGWRPPVLDSAGLPPLEQAAEAGKALKAQADANLKGEKAALDGKWTRAQERLTEADAAIRQQEAAEDKRLKEVEAELKRPLKPEERGKVRYLAGLNRQNTQIIQALSKPGEGDDEEYIREIAAVLGRALTPQERQLARGLHREGRAAADIAKVLLGAPGRAP